MVWISEAVKKCGGHRGEAPAGLADDGEVVLERQRGIVPALEQHGGGALRGRELDLLQHLLDGEGPGFRIPRLAIEGAELAVGDADIGVVRVAVDHEGDLARRDRAEARLLGESPHLHQGGLGEKPPSIRAVETLACLGLGPDLVEAAQVHTFTTL
jgi:hypothetical protein